MVVHAGTDHAGEALHGYRVFVNPSTSDVLCTATYATRRLDPSAIGGENPSALHGQCG